MVNDTSKIKAMYERNNLHIAELAHQLVQNLKYEMYKFRHCNLTPRPETKKGVDNSQKQINEMKRKEAEHKKNATELLKQYEKSCAAQKIEVIQKNDNSKFQGVKLREEILGLVDTELPGLFGEVTRLTQKDAIKDAITVYKEWISYLLSKTKNYSPQVRPISFFSDAHRAQPKSMKSLKYSSTFNKTVILLLLR